MKIIQEKSRKTKVVDQFDVTVIGGGIAGVSAALAAARNGARTCLIDKETCPGGLATLGLVVIYLPLCDGRGNQIIGGIGEELMKNSVRYGPGQIPPCWREGGNIERRKKQRYRLKFNAASFMISMEELLAEAGVSLFYDCRFCDTYQEGQEIKAVILETKEGRIAIEAKTVVDATGDADVCDSAGEETEVYHKNIRTAWYFSYDGEDLKLHQLTDPMYRIKKGQPLYSGASIRDIFRLNYEGRQMIMEHVRETNRDTGKQTYPLLIPTCTEFLMTRKLKGSFELDTSHERVWFDDTVAMTGDWRRKGPVYCIPLSSLTGTRNKNLITAGRCISTTQEMWDITRVIPTCAVTGEAAGTAAAMYVKKNAGSYQELNIPYLQSMIRSNGGILDKKLTEPDKLAEEKRRKDHES